MKNYNYWHTGRVGLVLAIILTLYLHLRMPPTSMMALYVTKKSSCEKRWKIWNYWHTGRVELVLAIILYLHLRMPPTTMMILYVTKK